MMFVAVDSPERIAAVAQLAQEIWYEHYVPIVGRAQVDFMIAKFQSIAAIRAQLASGYEYYLVEYEGEPVGYTGLQVQPEGVMFISKFYLRSGVRGRGISRSMLAFIEGLSRERGLRRLVLTVNKYNFAVQVYLRLGFINQGSVVTQIGDGFVMDDFCMEKTLAS